MRVRLNALIIESEELSLRRFRKLLYEAPHSVRVAGEVNSVEKAVRWLENNRLAWDQDPELLFLDIELFDEQCCAVFRQMNLKSVIVFMTSYDEYVFQVFKANDIAYLLKPFHHEELTRKLETCGDQPCNSGTCLFEKMEKLLEDLKKRPGDRTQSFGNESFQ